MKKKINNQLNTIRTFCKKANHYLVKYDKDFGKILKNEEIEKINLSLNEIYRSIKNEDDSMLFIYKINHKDNMYVLNPLQLLLHSLEEARAIEAVYPHLFNWIFDGLYLKAYALIPSHDFKAHTTITRYGGTENFYKILIQHLSNIGKMKKGQSPDYDFTSLNISLQESELSIGSINRKTNLYSIEIDIKDTYKEIINNSKKFNSKPKGLKMLNMKYWAKEINPDFISEAKHIKLENPIPFVEEMFNVYPLPIKRIMKLKHKGNFNRYLISRFLLNVHSPKDAKFVYYSVLGDEEREHIKSGNCSTQWNYIKNNLSKYDCPSLRDVSEFIKEGDPKLSHLLEPLQDYINKKEVKNESINSM